jgi:subfamily B ATP-binding cassette protein MsbA
MVAVTPGKPKKSKAEQFRGAMPLVMELVRPRRRLLWLGMLLMLFNRGAGLVTPASVKFLVDDIVGKRHIQLLTPLVLAVFVATIVQGVTSFTLTQLLSIEGQRLIAHLRRRVQEHVGRLPVAYYDANKSGMLVTRIMNDVEGVRNLIGTGLVELVGGLLTSIFAFIFLVRISALLTGSAVLFMAIFGLVLRKAFAYIRPIFRERSKINSEVAGRLTESLAGVRVVKGYHAEEQEAHVFSGGVQRLLDNVMKSLTAQSLMMLSATVLMGLVWTIIMFLGARQIFAGSLTLGGLMSFTAFLAYLVSPVFQVAAIGTQLTDAMAGLDRTADVLREKPEDEEPRRKLQLGTINGLVAFENVHFAYQVDKPVLHDISFVASPGTVTALVGPSGSGKSTIISLISAFHEPSQGTVRVDGEDLSTIRLDSFRTQLGVVLQETFLFDGTIRENVAFSRPSATEEEILEACRIAHVHEFAERLPSKYDTVVGERGVKLSGGQRQRVSIARAILANPRILILDEATSSLDSESEQAIQQGLAYLMEGRTTFVIAHRLSTIRRADQILVVEDGRIRERGTHESLYELRGRYFDLYTRQHGLDANLFLAPGEGDQIPERPEVPVRAAGTAAPSAASLLRGGM